MEKWVIVVDDDILNLKVAGYILSRNDMRVTSLSSGKELLDCVAENGTPDLILLDISMPEMDGFEALAKLRETEKANGWEETPVVFLTAAEGADAETHGFEAGVSDYIKNRLFRKFFCAA